MKLEQNGTLLFLDGRLVKYTDGSLWRAVCHKPMHKNLYTSHHHLAQKPSFLRTLLHRTKSIADAEHPLDELVTLKQVFLYNRFSKMEVEWVMGG